MGTKNVFLLSCYLFRGIKNAICLVCGLPILIFHGGRGLLSLGGAWVGLVVKAASAGLGLQGGVVPGISRLSVGAMAAEVLMPWQWESSLGALGSGLFGTAAGAGGG